MTFIRSARMLIALCALVVGIGCTALPEAEPNADQTELTDELSNANSQFTEAHLELIATDMVSAMIQVRELNPLSTTMQYSEPTSLLGELILDKLRAAWYGMQIVSADQGPFYIGYQSRNIVSDIGLTTDVIINIAGIGIRREYSVSDGNVVPTSLMYISGSNSAENIILNESLFLAQSDDIRFESGVEIELPDSTVLTSATRDVGAGSLTITVGGEDAILEARGAMLARSSKEILDARAEYRDLQRALLQFEDTNLTVGQKNKAVLKQVLVGFDDTKDALFLSSCAGDTSTPEQAAERSSRIKEELVLTGIPIDTIVEEGCVVGNYPSRSVEPRTVVLLHSRIDASRKTLSAKAPLEFPNRPLVMTIPYGAGGATDYQARIVTMIAGEEEHLGQPIQIVNKTGQGGRAGWSWFAETAKDTGYDIASYNVPHFIAQSIKFETPYNIDTLEPIANWGADPAVLVVPKDSDFKSVEDLVRYARANPNRLTVSGAGKYVGHHIALLQFEKAAKIKTDYISDKGGAAALEQVVKGEVMAGFNNMSDAFRRSDKLRILAIADLERNDFLPNVQTFLELGLNIDNSSVNYRGLMVPKGTPSAVIDRLSEAALKMFDNETVVNRMKEGGAPIRVMDRASVLSMWNERQAALSVLLRGL